MRAECHMQALYTECRYAECRYAECRGAEKNLFRWKLRGGEKNCFCLHLASLQARLQLKGSTLKSCLHRQNFKAQTSSITQPGEQ